jgi:hypothetical protein
MNTSQCSHIHIKLFYQINFLHFLWNNKYKINWRANIGLKFEILIYFLFFIIAVLLSIYFQYNLFSFFLDAIFKPRNCLILLLKIPCSFLSFFYRILHLINWVYLFLLVNLWACTVRYLVCSFDFQVF